MEHKEVFANNLKKYMDINGKSRREVCQALGYSYFTFSDWVNGKKMPRMDKVEQLANYFGILKSDLSFTNFSLVWFLEILAYPAVNCFVLISGYVGYREHQVYPKLQNFLSPLFHSKAHSS